MILTNQFFTCTYDDGVDDVIDFQINFFQNMIENNFLLKNKFYPFE